MATKKARTARTSRTSVVKASEIKVDLGDTLLTPTVENIRAGETKAPGGSLTPPYDPEKLYELFEDSAWLLPCVEAYQTNIESFGHHFIPAFDLTGDDVMQRVSDSIMLERAAESMSRAETPAEPTEGEIAARLEELRRRARFEYAILRVFFSCVCPQFSFTELRRRTRKDLEVTGNAYWEVTRNEAGEVVNFYYTPSTNIRLMSLDKTPVEVEERVRLSEISWAEITRQRYFRRRMLIERGKPKLYFKEFGDPRVMSRLTGKYYETPEAQLKADKQVPPATELIHFSIPTPLSPYGVPRYTGNIPGVMGSKTRDHVNLKYFKNNVVPPLALLVAGGRLASGAVEKIREHIQEQLRGGNAFYRILVLEAEGQKAVGEPGPKAVPKVQFVPLRDAQLNDATFQEYDKSNELKIAKSFRLPRLLRGDDSSINKATAWAALRFAEEQVFEPERELFDEFMNRQIMPELNISFWTFRSNAPISRDPEVQANIVALLTKNGVLLPNEARTIVSDIFNRQFIEIAEDWTNQPLPITLAQLRRKDLETTEDEEDEGRLPDGDDVGDASGNGSPRTARERPLNQLSQAGTPLQALGARSGSDD